MLMLGEAQGVVSLDTSRLDAGVSQAMGSLSRLDGMGRGGLGGGLDRLEGRLNAVGMTTTQLGVGLMGLGGAMLAPITVGIKGMMDFEHQMDAVASALGTSSDQLGDLEDLFMKVGADGQYSALQMAAVGEELAKSGYDVKAIMGDVEDGSKSMIKAVSDLASATGSDLSTSVNAITTAMASWSPDIVGDRKDYRGVAVALTDASKAADILTSAANASKADIADIQGGMKNFGATAASFGITFEDTAAAIALFTNYGVPGREAGTSLTRALVNLSKPTAEAATLMNELGISAFDMEGNFKGLPNLFEQLNKTLSGSSDEYRQWALSTMFGADALDVMTLGMQSGAEGFAKMRDQMDNVGVASRQAAERVDNLKGALERMREGAMNLLMQFAGGLIKPLTWLANAVDGLVALVGRIPEPILAAVGAFVALAGVLALVSGGFLLIAPRVLGFLSTVRALAGTGGALGGAATGLLRLGNILNFVRAAFMRMLTLPILGIGILAYNTNLFGFGDWIDTQVSKALSAWDRFKSIWGGEGTDGARGKTYAAGTMFGFDQVPGSGADGFDYIIRDSNGKEIGRQLESWWGEDGRIHARVELENGEIVEAIYNEDRTTLVIDTQFTIGDKAATPLTALQRFNKGMDTMGEWAEKNGLGVATPLLDGIQSVVNTGAGWLSSARGVGRWYDEFSDAFDGTRGIPGMSLWDRMKSAWNVSTMFMENDWVDRVDGFIAQTDFLMANGVSPIDAGLQALGSHFPALKPATDIARKALGHVTTAMDKMAGTRDRVTGLFNMFRGAGMGPVQAGLAALSTAFPRAAGVFNALNAGLRDARGRWEDAGQAIDGFRKRFKRNLLMTEAMASTDPTALGRKPAYLRYTEALGETLRDYGFEGLGNFVEDFGAKSYRAWGNFSDGMKRAGRNIKDFALNLDSFQLDLSRPNIAGKISDFVGWIEDTFSFEFENLGANLRQMAITIAPVFLGAGALIGGALKFIGGILAGIGSVAWDIIMGRPTVLFGWGAGEDGTAQEGEGLDGFLENFFGNAVQVSVNAVLDLGLAFLGDPGGNARNLLLGLLVAGLGIMAVTAGITPVLIVGAILGVAALGVTVFNAVKDYFRKNPEAVAEIRLKISTLWDRLEGLEHVGWIFQWAGMAYDAVSTVVGAFWSLRETLVELGGPFEWLVNRFERTLALAGGLNVLSKIGSGYFKGATRNEFMWRYALAGLWELAKFPFRLIFRPMQTMRSLFSRIAVNRLDTLFNAAGDITGFTGRETEVALKSFRSIIGQTFRYAGKTLWAFVRGPFEVFGRISGPLQDIRQRFETLWKAASTRRITFDAPKWLADRKYRATFVEDVAIPLERLNKTKVGTLFATINEHLKRSRTPARFLGRTFSFIGGTLDRLWNSRIANRIFGEQFRQGLNRAKRAWIAFENGPVSAIRRLGTTWRTIFVGTLPNTTGIISRIRAIFPSVDGLARRLGALWPTTASGRRRRFAPAIVDQLRRIPNMFRLARGQSAGAIRFWWQGVADDIVRYSRIVATRIDQRFFAGLFGNVTRGLAGLFRGGNASWLRRFRPGAWLDNLIGTKVLGRALDAMNPRGIGDAIARFIIRAVTLRPIRDLAGLLRTSLSLAFFSALRRLPVNMALTIIDWGSGRPLRDGFRAMVLRSVASSGALRRMFGSGGLLGAILRTNRRFAGSVARFLAPAFRRVGAAVRGYWDNLIRSQVGIVANPRAFAAFDRITDVIAGIGRSRAIRGLFAPLTLSLRGLALPLRPLIGMFDGLGGAIRSFVRGPFDGLSRGLARAIPYLERFGSAGPRVAAGMLIAAAATAIWKSNIFGVQDAYGGIFSAIGRFWDRVSAGFAEGGLGGAMDVIFDDIETAITDWPNTLANIMASPAWSKTLTGLGFIAGIRRGGPIGLMLAFAGPPLARFASDMIAAGSRIFRAWDQGGPTEGLRQMRVELLKLTWDSAKWFYNLGDGMERFGVSLRRIPFIGDALGGFFEKAGRRLRRFGFMLGKAAQDYQDLRAQGATPMQALHQSMKDNFPRVVSFLTDLQDAWWDLKDVMGELGFGDLWRSVKRLKGPLGRITGSFGKLLEGDFSGFWDDFSGGVKELVPALGDVASGIFDIASTGARMLRRTLNPAFTELRKQFPTLIPQLNQLEQGFGDLLGGVGDVWEGMSRLFQGDLPGAMESFRSGLSGIWSGLQQIGSGIWGMIQEIDWSAVGSTLQGWWDSTVTWFQGLPWSTIWDTISGALSAIPWGTLWEGLKTGVQELWNAFTGLDWGAIASEIEGLGGPFLALSWTINFIRGAWGRLESAVNAVKSAWNWLKQTIPGLEGPMTAAEGPIGSLAEKLKDLLVTLGALMAVGFIFGFAFGGVGGALRGLLLPLLLIASPFKLLKNILTRFPKFPSFPSIPAGLATRLPLIALGFALVKASIDGWEERTGPVGALREAIEGIGDAIDALRNGESIDWSKLFWEDFGLKDDLDALKRDLDMILTIIDTINSGLRAMFGFFGVDGDNNEEFNKKQTEKVKSQEPELVKNIQMDMGAGLTWLDLGPVVTDDGRLTFQWGGIESVPKTPQELFDFLTIEVGMEVDEGEFEAYMSDILGQPVDVEVKPRIDNSAITGLASRLKSGLLGGLGDGLNAVITAQQQRNLANILGGGGGGGGGSRTPGGPTMLQQPTVPTVRVTPETAGAFQGLTTDWRQDVITAMPQIIRAVTQPIGTIPAAVNAGFTPIQTTVVSTMGAAQAGAVAASAGMRTGVVGNVAGIAGGVTGQFVLARTGAVGNAAGMNAGVVGSTAGMAGSVLGQTAGMAGGVAGQTGYMAGAAVGNAMTMGGGMTAGAMLGAAGTAAGMFMATAAVGANAGQWVGIIYSVSGGMFGAGMAAGSAAGQGVAAGLRSAHGAVRAEAAALIATVRNAMAVAGEMRSPSRLMAREIGVPLVEGIAKGMMSHVARRGLNVAAFGVMGAVDRDLRGAAGIASPARRFSFHGLMSTLGLAEGLEGTRSMRALASAASTVMATLDRRLQPEDTDISWFNEQAEAWRARQNRPSMATPNRQAGGGPTYIDQSTHKTLGDMTFQITATDPKGTQTEIVALLDAAWGDT